MSAHGETLLAVLAGLALPWLAWAWLEWRAAPLPPASGNARYFRMGSGLRWMGPALMLFGPTMILLMAFFVPTKSGEWPLVFAISLFLGGIESVVGFNLWRAVLRVDDAGLTGWSLSGQPSYIAWREVRAIAFSTGMQALRFEGAGKRVYVPVMLDDWPGFLDEVRRHLPHLPLPSDIHADGEKLAIEGHFQGMYDHAAQIFLAAAGLVLLTLPFLPLYPPAAAFSAAGGVGLALFPLVRRLMPKPKRFSATIGNLIEFVGVMGGIYLASYGQGIHVQHLGGEDAIDGGQFLALLGQHLLGLPVLVAALLLLIAKWRWPERFARERMRRRDA